MRSAFDFLLLSSKPAVNYSLAAGLSICICEQNQQCDVELATEAPSAKTAAV